jgi:hypothetical protein
LTSSGLGPGQQEQEHNQLPLPVALPPALLPLLLVRLRSGLAAVVAALGITSLVGHVALRLFYAHVVALVRNAVPFTVPCSTRRAFASSAASSSTQPLLAAPL